MKLLLDTHIWIWSIGEAWKLTSEVQNEMASPSNELWLSPISVWELVLLRQKGRLHWTADLGEWVRQSFADLNLREAPLTTEIALDLPFIAMHKDPGDRFLVATARAYGLTLVTNDAEIIQGAQRNHLQVLANR
jgi:PIN domain nuclease of toxin-antitoxin system